MMQKEAHSALRMLQRWGAWHPVLCTRKGKLDISSDLKKSRTCFAATTKGNDLEIRELFC